MKIIVCSQVSLHEYFIDYLSWLCKEDSGAKILLKPHPGETENVYSELKKFDNLMIVDHNINNLFPLVDIHISIYSATLLESLKYGLKNYSIAVDVCKDYIGSFVKEGISLELKKGEVPKLPLKKDTSVGEKYFKPFVKINI